MNKVVRYYDSGNFDLDKFAYGWTPAHPTFFIRREIYQKYGNFEIDYEVAADFDILTRFLYLHKISFTYIKEVLVVMRLGGVSTSFNSIWVNSFEQLRACKRYNIKTNIFKILSKYPSKLVGFIKKS